MKQKTAWALLLLLWTPALQAQTPFFQGKTITIVVPTKAGDLYDLYPRLLAEHLPKYIPGAPNIIVQNMPGAASLIAANHVYNVAKPDGLTLGSFYPALYLDQLAKRPEVKFDWLKWNWIGSPVKSNHLLYIRSDTPYKSMDDIRKSPTPPKCGATGTTSSANYLVKLFEETLGTRFDIVTGYPAGVDIDLAVERGEVQCRAFTITSYFAREPFISWSKRNFVRVLIQTGTRRDERLRDVPTVYELMDRYQASDTQRRLATALLAAGDFGRPIAAAPGVPAERLKILREAFDKAVRDPQLLVDAKKRKLEIDPASSEELAALAKEVMAASPEVAEKVKQLLGN
jgi:tripartite-type tricarboxylate transporter receptor subunit TctC